MVLRKLVRSNYERKLSVSIKHENIHSFKEGVILLCQSILETRRISHFHHSSLFTIPLMLFLSNLSKIVPGQKTIDADVTRFFAASKGKNIQKIDQNN